MKRDGVCEPEIEKFGGTLGDRSSWEGGRQARECGICRRNKDGLMQEITGYQMLQIEVRTWVVL